VLTQGLERALVALVDGAGSIGGRRSSGSGRPSGVPLRRSPAGSEQGGEEEGGASSYSERPSSPTSIHLAPMSLRAGYSMMFALGVIAALAAILALALFGVLGTEAAETGDPPPDRLASGQGSGLDDRITSIYRAASPGGRLHPGRGGP